MIFSVLDELELGSQKSFFKRHVLEVGTISIISIQVTISEYQHRTVKKKMITEENDIMTNVYLLSEHLLLHLLVIGTVETPRRNDVYVPWKRKRLDWLVVHTFFQDDMLFLMKSEEELRNILTKVQLHCLRFIYKVQVCVGGNLRTMDWHTFCWVQRLLWLNISIGDIQIGLQ